jgi:hypothetical protein
MNNDSYKLKYLKYKEKYLELKEMNAGMNPVEVNMIEKIRILKDEMKVLNDLIIKINRGENINIFEIIKLKEYSRISKYVYDIFRSWFLESEEGREWLLKKREELKLIKNEEAYNLKINLLTDNITLEQIEIENDEDGNIISVPVNQGYDEIENTININIHTHPYNQGLHYLDFKLPYKGELNYPKLLSMPSNIDINTSLEANLRYYTFDGIISESDISFYSMHEELIMEMIQNPIKHDLLFDVLMYNANHIKSDLVMDIYQRLSTEELISQLKKRYLNLLEHDSIKAIKFEIIKLD